MEQGGCAYILTNDHHTVLYVGVTHDLSIRLYEHKKGEYPNSFTKKYNVHKLIYYEFYPRIEEAIAREKEIKKWNRKKKEKLISTKNPGWHDLAKEIE
ncbi:MAG: excinuclease ABC subunit C [Bacteroidetes bacterium SW_11_45_7]|jgi:putative endonuclease|nr:MAG: excinuclease ABC subunit C [Bacteroidetes bacterium SW_11_45_7]